MKRAYSRQQKMFAHRIPCSQNDMPLLKFIPVTNLLLSQSQEPVGFPYIFQKCFPLSGQAYSSGAAEEEAASKMAFKVLNPLA